MAAQGRVVADTFWSQALGIRKRALVYLPPSYGREPARRYPVAYYLHGLWGSENDWTRAGHLDRAADSLATLGVPEMIVVMPDGDDGWWTTWSTLPIYADCQRDTTRREPAASYCVPWTHYDDYVARDLVAHVDSTYRTRARREARAVAGLSMGGYGAVTLALRYPDVFAAAASHSGVLSPLLVGPRPFAAPARFAGSEEELKAGWGPVFWRHLAPVFGRDTAGWWARDPARLAARARAAGRPLPRLFVDAGRGDERFVDQSRAFHAALTAAGIRHEYAEWPGGHDWTYWSGHVGESLAWIANVMGSRE